MSAFAGNNTEMYIQLIEAFGGPRPPSFNQTELDIALINAVSAFTPATGNSGWRAFTIGFGSAFATGQPLFISTTGDLITDFLPIVLTAYDGLTPMLDLNTGATIGLLESRYGQAANNPTAGIGKGIPLWNAAVTPGSNSGLLVPAAAPAGTSAMSYSAAMASLVVNAGPPASPSPMYVQAGSQVFVTISQDGRGVTDIPATLLAPNTPTLPITVSGSNNSFLWKYTSAPGGVFGTPVNEIFTVANGTYTTLNAVENALKAATGSVSSEAFSTHANVTDNGTKLLITDNGGGFAGNSNSFSAAQSNDITATLGFSGLGILTGGQGGDPGSTQGSMILLVATSTPQAM
jgi:hypothetical protein